MKEQEKRKNLQAAALKYDMGRDNAPLIVGLGKGYVAEKMLTIAEEEKIPVVEDDSLLSVLNRFSIGDEIPEEIYEVVAQVLVFISKLDGEAAGRYRLEDIKKGKHR